MIVSKLQSILLILKVCWEKEIQKLNHRTAFVRPYPNIFVENWQKFSHVALNALTFSPSKSINIFIRYPLKSYYIKCPQKNATDLKKSDTSCFELIVKKLFFSTSAMIRLNFDKFLRFLVTWLQS